MSSHQSLIMLVVVLGITATGIFVMNQQTQLLGTEPKSITSSEPVADSDDLVFVNVVAVATGNTDPSEFRFQVRYEGDEELPLNETVIQIRTDKSVADLAYRNGTLTRSIATGYYTE